MNQPSNISEAARRREIILEAVKSSPNDGEGWKSRMVDKIAAALDSTHPAPKEGETPETDEEYRLRGERVISEFVRKSFARSLELRLAEKTREVDRWKNWHQLLKGDYAALRTRLQQAEELLREAKDMFLPPESDYGHTPPKATLLGRIATFLNSKTP